MKKLLALAALAGLAAITPATAFAAHSATGTFTVSATQQTPCSINPQNVVGLNFGTQDYENGNKFANASDSKVGSFVLTCGDEKTNIALTSANAWNMIRTGGSGNNNSLAYKICLPNAVTLADQTANGCTQWGDGNNGTSILALSDGYAPSDTATIPLDGYVPDGQDPNDGQYSDTVTINVDIQDE